MLFDPVEAEAKLKAAQEREKAKTVVTPQGELVTHQRHREFKGNFRLFERWVRFKQFVLLKASRKKDEGNGDDSERKKSLFSIFFW
jgi:hypothetical protein